MKLISILFFFTFTVIGQNIKGVVLDKETQKPLANVNIYHYKLKTGTATNKKGQFNLKITSKINPTDSITFSFIGYETRSYTISTLKQQKNVVNLSKKTETLDEVTVTSNKNLKSEITYKKLSPLLKGVYNFDSALINNKLYVVTGNTTYFEDVAKKALDISMTFGEFLKNLKSDFTWENHSDIIQIYDLEKDTWQNLDLKLKKRAYHNIVFLNEQIYVFGGKTLSRNRTREYLDNTIEVLNLNTKKVTVDYTYPHQAINAASFSYQDNIIVMGGSVKRHKNGKKNYTDKSHIYNITSGYWYDLPKMTEAKEVNGILVKDRIYLIGGFNKKPLSKIESYDLISGKWNNEGKLFSGIENPALTHKGNVIYIFNKNKIMTYNVVTKILDEYRIDLSIENADIHFYRNNLYILGGSIEDDYTKTPSSKLYSIDINEFDKTKIIRSKKNESNIISNQTNKKSL